MVNKNLIATLSIEDSEAESMLMDAFGDDVAGGDMESLLEVNIEDFTSGKILQGKVIGMAGDDFLVDVGLKSEGILDKHEFENPADVEVGDTVEVEHQDTRETFAAEIIGENRVRVGAAPQEESGE